MGQRSIACISCRLCHRECGRNRFPGGLWRVPFLCCLLLLLGRIRGWQCRFMQLSRIRFTLLQSILLGLNLLDGQLQAALLQLLLRCIISVGSFFCLFRLFCQLWVFQLLLREAKPGRIAVMEFTQFNHLLGTSRRIDLRRLRRHDAVQLGILREPILERQNDVAVEQQTLAFAALSDIGQLMRGNA